jgi:hypothetical protein
MCKKCGESIDHLFLHYEVATELWSVFLQLFGVCLEGLMIFWEVGGDNWEIVMLCKSGGWLFVFNAVSLARAERKEF